MMTEQEKKAFLKQMGYHPRADLLESYTEAKNKQEKKVAWAPKDEEDARLLLKLNKLFNGETKEIK